MSTADEAQLVHSSASTLTDTATTTANGRITLSDEGPARLVTMSGSITVTLREQASVVLSTVATSSLPLIIDLHRVTGFDNSGLAFMYQLAEIEHELGKPVIVRGAPNEVVMVLDALGADSRYDVE